MGQEQSGAGFRERDWQQLARNNRCTTWQNVRHPAQRIEEYRIHANGEREVEWLKNMYYLRKNHRSIVSALYLQNHSGRGLCSDSHAYSIFLQRIPITLADIEHIPFPDYLHLYGQCLRGYAEMVRQVGCFEVEEEYIGVNEEGVVKVWLQPDTSRTHLLGGKVSEGNMLRSIIDVIHQNIDNSRNRHLPHLKDYLYRNSNALSFQQANEQYQKYLREHQISQPNRLQCIDVVGGIDVIANRPREEYNHFEYVDTPSSTSVVQPPLGTTLAVPAQGPLLMGRKHSEVLVSFPPQPKPHVIQESSPTSYSSPSPYQPMTSAVSHFPPKPPNFSQNSPRPPPTVVFRNNGAVSSNTNLFGSLPSNHLKNSIQQHQVNKSTLKQQPPHQPPIPELPPTTYNLAPSQLLSNSYNSNANPSVLQNSSVRSRKGSTEEKHSNGQNQNPGFEPSSHLMVKGQDKSKSIYDPSKSGSVVALQRENQRNFQPNFNFTGLLLPYNPTQGINPKAEHPQSISGGSRYKDFDLNEGTSSPDFLRQFKEYGKNN